MRMTDPSADLAILMAVASAYTDIALPANMVFIGEVGLAGDIRRTAAVGKRISEAARLGYTHAVIPPKATTCTRPGCTCCVARRWAGPSKYSPNHARSNRKSAQIYAWRNNLRTDTQSP